MITPTQDEIIKQVDILDQKIAEHRHAIIELKLKKDFLQSTCEHPNKYQYSAMGELGWKCPDCKWQT